ncbi:carbohydrate binding family 9 domain-containing protein [Mucilaginibacter ginkgonis]|uniref:Carbohydrate binding family 9 domain-containing protein n=2 Tax=Mucilaginibacter ginkgonis TaxID=2682091 RepID=A0A6I4HYU9_9SPHI|nr:carbohydrate binding family 9 domain-containing protein [Mucilaginibacter ginkgonis]
MKLKISLTFLLTLFIAAAFAQTGNRKYAAVKTSLVPKIDGVLDDEAWKNIPIATDFVQLQPSAGVHEAHDERTEVKIMYDDKAVYVAARMYEKSMSAVAAELSARDSIANADIFGIFLDTYLDRINASGFIVSSSGVQFDAKYSQQGNEDPSWNAVWYSATKIDSQGWTCEMRIPYSALRFSEKDVQTWGMNLIRRRRFANQQQLFWNDIDPKKNGFINQEGEMTNIQKIHPPVRLGFYPYASAFVNHYPYNTAGIKNTTSSIGGGMDIKYGINAAFTLDLTLIPDFSQVQSDNRILNLTPFEVKYAENRPFFTEGTELFNKGNLFYSRRIGGQPIDYNTAYNNLGKNEAVLSNPSETKLYNAIKFSGRTAKGLGIGVFNAITGTTNAVVQDTVTGNTRLVQTSPLANYNIIVLDQNLKNNSSVTLINTNVNRFGKDYNADVSAFLFSLNNKKNSYNFSGFGKMSNLFYPDHTSTGYAYELGAAKTLGNFTWTFKQDLVDSKFSPNDLGILFNNNFLDHDLQFIYSNYHPKKYFTSWYIYTELYYSRRYLPTAYQNFNYFNELGLTFKNQLQAYLDLSIKAAGNDFYEPRVANLMFIQPASQGTGITLRTNAAKRLSGGMQYFYRAFNTYGAYGYDARLYYSYRVNNHFSFGQDVTYSPRVNNTGFATLDSEGTNPIFALRNVQTIQNIFKVKYTFTSTMGITLRARHYWSKLDNKQFLNLASDGNLTEIGLAKFNHNVNQNYNIWNVDMLYSWVFSPGSELSISYKNSSLTNILNLRNNYFSNLGDTFTAPSNNNFSVKVLYYIDYQDLRKRKHS